MLTDQSRCSYEVQHGVRKQVVHLSMDSEKFDLRVSTSDFELLYPLVSLLAHGASENKIHRVHREADLGT